tara:strand:+ start:33 stop:380 length:348 start_codon:yes stop_codon:yes gene_type:complete
MGIKEMAEQDKLDQAEQYKKDEQQGKKQVYSLKEFEALAENPLFVKWFAEYVEKPAAIARKSHEIELDTNKNFCLKGRVQAYKAQYGWLAEVRNKRLVLEKRLYKEDEEDNSPED